MKEYYGIVEIVSVKNQGSIPEFSPMDDSNARTVHYPDCQQLIIRLPQYGRTYGKLRLINEASGLVEEEMPVADLLNGEVQIIRDTLPLAPGSYIIEIYWKDDARHLVSFIKHEELTASQKALQATKPGPGHSKEHPEIPKPRKRIEYEGNLRAGNVIYIDGDLIIRFDHEMGGGNCIVYIFIPTEKEWEYKTGTPLADRAGILQFVAENVRAKQVPGSRVEITPDQISFFSR